MPNPDLNQFEHVPGVKYTGQRLNELIRAVEEAIDNIDVDVDAAVAAKADVDYVDEALALKADVADVEGFADEATVNAALALKANTSDLAAKADTTTVNTALALKANKNGETFTGPVTATNLSGTNTGDETAAGIRSKLGIATLSGANTGDETSTTVLTKLASVDGRTYVSLQAGGNSQARMIAAFNAVADGGTVVFAPGGVTELTSAVKIGDSGDVTTGKNVRVIAHGHTFRMMADGAKLEMCGPVSATLSLSANYTKGSRTLTVSHTGAQLNDFVRGRWIKIVSDSLDGWNRNQGTQTNQYRLGEWAQIRKVVDNGSGTATITLWNPLKFTRGFTNTGDAENLTEGDTYTTANNARIVALKCDNFQWEGGTFETDAASTHIGAGGWNSSGTIPLFHVQGYARPIIDKVTVGEGTGKGLALSGCPEFTVNSLVTKRLPDNSEQSANDGISTSYLGYALAIAGCWGGVVNDLVVKDSRHGVTESNTTVSAGFTSYGNIMAMGRTYGTRINNMTVGGQYSSAVDTHHGAHAWTISNPTVLGTQAGSGINLRGPNHVVIGGQITAHKGINVMSEWADSGGSDLPALVGNGNKWMSSARIIGTNIDCTTEAVSATAAMVTLEAGGKIRCRTHNVFNFPAGVIDFASGKFEVEITGEASAATVNGDTTQRGMFQGGDASSQWGITWTPSAIIREGATVDINASAAVDTVAMKVAGQTGSNSLIQIKGNLIAQVPATGMTATFADVIRFELYRTGVLSLTGNSTVEGNYPVWRHGRVSLTDLAPSVSQKLLSVRDTIGGPSTFYATIRLFVQDQTNNVAPLVAEYTVQEQFGAGGTAEYCALISGSTTDFESINNTDLSSTAPTTGKIAMSFKDGTVMVRHEKAGVTYKSVFADITIWRQPSF